MKASKGVDQQLKSTENTNNQKIRVNTVIMGEPAAWLNEWKRRGLVTSYTDAIIQALRVFNEKITEQDLKSAQLRNIEHMDSR